MIQYFKLEKTHLGDIQVIPCEPEAPECLPGVVVHTQAGHTIRAVAIQQQYDYAKKRATIAIYAEMKPSGDDGFIQLPRTGNRPRWRSGAPIAVEDWCSAVTNEEIIQRLHQIFED